MSTIWTDDVWEDVWTADGVWAEFVPFSPAPLISGITVYALLGGAALITPAVSGTSDIYPAFSGSPNANEFRP